MSDFRNTQKLSMRNKAKTLLMGWVLPLFFPSTTLAQDIERGRELFENHCQACHRDSVKLFEHPKVKDPVELKKRIQGWALHMGSDWSESEIEDVLHFLNHKTYHFNP